MDWEEFFKKYGPHVVSTLDLQDPSRPMTVETIYQAFKARIIDEVLSKGFVSMGPA